ncbi:MAG: Glycosyltransferase [Candidatus Woesebacteria bacterium GW2011_GWA2_44_33]|uniref:Glycosyltransferase n=1 Tax=Candidatus Woesebacteria bacterium GW2011_GWA2_44_33 TaxID=1618564 RepID=A0A0G1J8E8_9BACT|nr:MAG: Glycosyltransferase [Candidatus Woesebacteria bacterium GW2011_GWA2_44_33]
MKIDLSIVTVGYKSEDTIVPFLDSIQKNRDNISKEVIVVDNYPGDKGADRAQKHPLKPTVIRNTENIGFSKGINQGIKVCHGEYVLIINPDTRIVGSALKYLLDFARKTTQLEAVVPRLLNYDGSIQPSCSKFPTIWNAVRYSFFGCKNCFKKYNPGDKTTKVEVAVMAAFLIPKTVLDYVGGLDERYFLYYEDVEFCRRLHLHGLSVYYLPKAKVQHIHGASGNFVSHLKSPLLKSAKIYYGPVYSATLNLVLWIGHKWQVILRRKKFRD